MELSIDTSTNFANVGLSDEGEPIMQLAWHSRRNHTVELARNINHLMENSRLKTSQITAIVLAVGPGGFSSLRVGMGLAKGMASSLEIPIIGVSTLMLEAYRFRHMNIPICPIIAINSSEFAWSIYATEDANLTTVTEPKLTKVEEIFASIPNETLVCGESSESIEVNIRKLPGNKTIKTALTSPSRSAFDLGRLGFERVKNGNIDDVATLQPMYLRKPNISKPKKSGKKKS